MTSRNDVTGDKIRSRVPSNRYRENYDKIFNKKNREEKKDESGR